MEESRRKEHQGGERFSPPWTHLSLVGGQGEVFSMFRDWPAAHKPTFVTASPPGWAGWGRWFLRREEAFPRPKPSPWGEGAPVRTLGRMRGRSCTQPFLVDVEKGGSRLSPQRNASPAPLGNPVAPSSVTSGDSFPPRGSLWVVQSYTKKRSKSGHVGGVRNSPTTETMRHNRQNQRVGTSGP